MGASYRLFGTETSPFSTKLRSYLRYKKLPFDWVAKGFGTDKEFEGLARSQALPMLVSPNGGVAHDTSHIIATLEKARPLVAATPEDTGAQAIALLLEEYADEWLNKAMFHYRWGTAATAKKSAARQVEHMFAGYDLKDRKTVEASVAKSMGGRLKLIGSTKKTGPVIEASFERFVTLLNAHLEHHLFIFGGHPSVADFALAGQLIQLMMDEKPGSFIREKAPFVSAWCEFMEDPRQGAPFEPLEALTPTLLPLIRDEVAETYVAWCLENTAAIAKKRKTVTVDMPGGEYKQGVQSHTASAFATLQEQFASRAETSAALALLEDAGLGEVFDFAPAKAPVAEVVTDSSDAEEAAHVVPDEPAPSEDAETKSES